MRNTPAHAGKTHCVDISGHISEKHPRACGEDYKEAGDKPILAETPPRMRGRLVPTAAVELVRRNTPAHAGKTLRLSPKVRHTGKHPRACGEDLPLCRRPLPLSETPPRMRGRLGDSSNHVIFLGNTPAHAGKTYRTTIGRYRSWKHPRACGEDIQAMVQNPISGETPPRMRGRQDQSPKETFGMRNTPAHAGKTNQMMHQTAHLQKHPRACGEDAVREGIWSILRETPPRMRGRLFTPSDPYLCKRNTPAHAGKTLSVPWSTSNSQKHPRACGEDSRSPITGRTLYGNTPAHAGKTARHLRVVADDRKHPRACGEDPPSNTASTGFGETPPRMRGRPV